jgi:hypothetical protein
VKNLLRTVDIANLSQRCKTCIQSCVHTLYHVEYERAEPRCYLDCQRTLPRQCRRPRRIK